MAKNRSVPTELTISLPSQTHAYLVKLASVGALGQTEALIAARIVIDEVERLIDKRRADINPSGGVHVADRHDSD